MGYDYNIPSNDSSGYQKLIDNQQEYINKLLGKKSENKTACKVSGNKQDLEHQICKYFTSKFDDAYTENNDYQQKLQKLQEQKQIEIKNAREKAEAAGKSQQEIEQIVFDIENNYDSQISLLQYNISKSNKSFLADKTNKLDAQSAYREARFDNIFASNNYMGTLLDLGNAYHDLGKMQQFQSFLESQSNNSNRNWLT